MKGAPAGPDNPFNNAFFADKTLLQTEKGARANLNGDTWRTWKIENPSVLKCVHLSLFIPTPLLLHVPFPLCVCVGRSAARAPRHVPRVCCAPHLHRHCSVHSAAKHSVMMRGDRDLTSRSVRAASLSRQYAYAPLPAGSDCGLEP